MLNTDPPTQFWTYVPNKEIETSAAYVLHKNISWVEYRSSFKTNHLGLIETNFNKDDSEVDYLIRFIVIIASVLIFYLTKKNLVYPTIFSAIILALINSYIV